MPRKKEGLTDIEASFFGDDDLDWLSDDAEDNAAPEAVKIEDPPAVPTAPEPAADPPAGESAPPAEPEAEPEPEPEPVVAEPAAAPEPEPVLVDSAAAGAEVPRAVAPAAPAPPPAEPPSPAAPPVEVAPPPAAAVSPTPTGHLADFDMMRAATPPPAPSSPAPSSTWDDSGDAFYGDSFEESEEAPLISGPRPRSFEPEPSAESALNPATAFAPFREQTPAPPDGPEPTADVEPVEEMLVPPAALVPPELINPPWAPTTDEAAAREAASALVAEAAHAPRDEQGMMLVAAGRVYRDLIGDLDAAAALFRDARANGVRSDALEEGLSEAAVRARDWDRAIATLEARAALSTDPVVAGEFLVDAALLARQQQRDQARALTLLQAALDRDVESYVAASLLRDAMPKDDTKGRASVLERIAPMADGRVAADAWWELGKLLDAADRTRDAQEAYANARDADPTHGPSLLALARSYKDRGDDVSLAALYEHEATRDGQTDPGWWWMQAARRFASAEQLGRADAAYAAAIEHRGPRAAREQQAWLTRAGRHEELAAAIRAEAEGLSGTARAHALMRLGAVLEVQLSDADGALAAYQEVAALAPAAVSAIDGAARLLGAQGKHDELLALQRQVAAAATGDAAGAARHRVAEVCELAADHVGAAEAYRSALVDQPTDEVAAEGVLRSLRAQEDWAGAVAFCEARAEVGGGSRWRARAAGMVERRLGDHSRALALWTDSLDADGRAIAIDAMVDAAEGAGVEGELATALEVAATGAGSRPEAARCLYRAAWLRAYRGEDQDSAAILARRCVELAPDFAPAVALARDLSVRAGRVDDAYRLAREEAVATSDAETRAWRLLAVAQLARGVEGANPLEDLLRVLAKDPAHPGALAELEITCLASHDLAALVEVYEMAMPGISDPGERAEVSARRAEILCQLDDTEGATRALTVLRNIEADHRPLRALSRLAEDTGLYREAEALLAISSLPEDAIERGRLLRQHLGRPRDALTTYVPLLDLPESAQSAAVGLALVAPGLGEAALLARAHATIAEHAERDVVQAAHGMWTASLRQAAGDHPGALEALGIALEARPSSRSAFEAARSLILRQGDADAARALYAASRPDDLTGLAETLERIAPHEAVEPWRAAHAADPSLPNTLHLERALTHAEAWPEVARVVEALLGRVKDQGVQARLRAKQRWLLAEKLADTEEAWALYQKLHEASPGDRDVTEAVARIAGARGETALAIQYLRELADTSPGPGDASRAQCRIGEVYEASGDLPGAKAAFLDALDHVSDEPLAIAGLRRVAEAEEDWPGLVQVLQREAGLAEGDARVDLLREIAVITEERLGDSGVAVDAWRSVLEAAPSDDVALRRLYALAESQSEWLLLVETGSALATKLAGEERSALLNRLGQVCEEQLDFDDALRFYDEAVRNAPPSVEAGRRMRGVLERMRDWPGVVRCLLQLADIDEEELRLGHVVEAAHIEADIRRDRLAAAGLYARVLREDPDHLVALRFMSGHLFAAGRLDEALPLFERLEPQVEEGQDSDDFDVRVELSSFYFRMAELLRLCGRRDDARARYERALELNPSHAPSLEAVAPLYVLAEDWSAASGVLRKLLQLTGGQGNSEKVASTYAQLGIVERALGNAAKAHMRFSKALEVHPNHIGGLQGMALVHEDRGEWGDLLNVYNNIIYHGTVRADVIDAYLAKGRILDTLLERPDKAREHYHHALTVDATLPLALVRLAELAAREAKYAEAGGFATRGLQTAAEAGPVRADLLLAWAVATRAAGDETASTAALTEARASDPELAAVLPEELSAESLAAALRSRVAARVAPAA